MDAQRKVIAIFLIGLLFVVYKHQVWDRYAQGPQKARQQKVEAGTVHHANPAAVSSAPASSSTALPAISSSTSPAPIAAKSQAQQTGSAVGAYPLDAEVEAAGILVLHTETAVIKLSLLGGRLTQYLLREYKTAIDRDSPLLNLVQHVEGAPYPLGVYSGELGDEHVLYSIAADVGSREIVLKGAQKSTIELVGTLADGRAIKKIFTFYGDGYLFDMNVELAPSATPSRVEVEWTDLLTPDSPSLLDPYHISGYDWFDGQKAQRKPFSELATELMELGNVRWVSLTDKYFMTTLVSPNELSRARAIHTGQIYSARLSGLDTTGTFRVFAGPKKYRMLQEVGYELHRNIDFGWTGFIAAPLLFLLYFLNGIFGNYGVAIVVLTILVKACLFPLNTAAFRQMKAMQDLQPEMKRIRENIKDRQQQQLELMALYKKKGVNPMGGCFPMLIQMPIFIGLYSALLLAIELRHAPFAFWINDLSTPEHIALLGFNIPILVLIMIASMLIQQWIMPSQMDPVQKKVMLVVPLIFGFMMAKLPAGLTIYMLTNNFVSIAQQQTMQRKNERSALLVAGATAVAVFVLAFVMAKVGT